MKNKKILIILSLIVIFVVGLLTFYNSPHRKASILVTAIKQEDCEKVEKLLSDGVDPNITTTSDVTEFILNAVESTGERPLSVACEVGNLEIVQMLIDYGATAEPYDSCGWSPLNQTLFHYQPEDKAIVQLLLQNGADINEEQPYGLPIFSAAEMLPKKYDKQDNNSAQYIGDYDIEVAQGITDIVKMLLEYGDYDVNLKSSYNGVTLLICAAKSENCCLVEYLISKGCDVTAKDNANKTALDYAQDNGNEEIMMLLKKTQGTVLWSTR